MAPLCAWRPRDRNDGRLTTALHGKRRAEASEGSRGCFRSGAVARQGRRRSLRCLRHLAM